MAATAMIGITNLRCGHDPLSALPRATSAARSCALPSRRRRCRLLTPRSSCCSPSSSVSPRRVLRPTAALKRIPAGDTRFVGPANNDATTLNRSSSDLRRRLIVPNSTASTGHATASSGVLPAILGVAHLVVSLGIMLAADKFLKKAFVAAGIKFPSALFGMFCVFSVLVVFDTFAPPLAKAFMNFFEPATMFIKRWLPVFYVPTLVVFPLAITEIPAASAFKIFAITLGGWFATLTVAGYAVLAVRNLVNTELIPDTEPVSKPSPFSTSEIWSWTAIFVASFGVAYFNPTALGTTAKTCLPFLLAANVLGYMVGSGLPAGVKKVLHPVISCALSADLAAAAYAYLSGSGFDAVLGDYLTKAASNPGAGDILMGFLGSVIISFAFSIFKQRKIVKRHAAEIFTSVAIGATFSLYSTAIIGRLVGLEPSLTISMLPRCITLALALSIVSFFEGVNSSVTAVVVVLTGLLGANFVLAAMEKIGLNDPISRGIATAASAQGLGTAALSAKEPEALPFCAISYSFTGIFGSLICSVPAVRQSLIFIAG
ncbi:plastidal glycolate/glycerate translocator 1, chloroplastic-like [Miscanthus floridulus]|uniref:plastidal glycolate/glycerate translocator 1, chloroplastic-like n=1 Tax=Miscanthus floridulus TaxID=154761 RepID=UPI00345A72B6